MLIFKFLTISFVSVKKINVQMELPMLSFISPNQDLMTDLVIFKRDLREVNQKL